MFDCEGIGFVDGVILFICVNFGGKYENCWLEEFDVVGVWKIEFDWNVG